MKTAILYHGDCPDGFGGAYAAWKKFGDEAEYLPQKHGKPFEGDVSGKDVYMIDFCFPKEQMDAIAAQAGSFTVLDHHEGVESVATSYPNHVYDPNRSGASIAWAYFHPDTEIPELIRYIEDDDLFRFNLPETRAVLTYLTAHPLTFTYWESVAKALAGDISRKEVLAVASGYKEYFELLAELAVQEAKLIEFEGHEVYFATAHPLKPLKSLVGNMLVKKKGPFALVVSAHPEGLGVSIRGDGTVNVADIAAKYGSSGHPNSAGFRLGFDKPMPWKFLKGKSID